MPSQTVMRPHLVAGRSIRFTRALTSLDFANLIAICSCNSGNAQPPRSIGQSQDRLFICDDEDLRW